MEVICIKPPRGIWGGITVATEGKRCRNDQASGSMQEEHPSARDVLILYGKDASEWCQYLQSLFHSCKDLWSYLVESGTPVPPEKVAAFKSSRCVIVLLSCELVQTFQTPAVLQSLQEVLQPPHKVVKLFCGVAEWEDYQEFFEDWSQWKHLTYDDDPETYVQAVMKAISEGGKLATSSNCL
ncbi:UNVERIFIED_CONTAM: hypothetical protein K2H54_004106 [Gekko kuhli]